jgi:succinate dehydrogenase flavin-adding protein (antitoxin of CptAB toxin-antitoxin module)
MAQTKEQLLQYFAGLDLSLLQKLEKYSKLLIIPDEDLLTYATMVQMVEKAHSVADSLFPAYGKGNLCSKESE